MFEFLITMPFGKVMLRKCEFNFFVNPIDLSTTETKVKWLQHLVVKREQRKLFASSPTNP